MVGRVELTWIDMDATSAPVAEYWQTLDRDECARANRFRFAKDQRRFVVRRGALRALLASRLGCPASGIRYSQNKFGKLSVVASDIKFNVSRSHSLALYVLTRGVEVGCDEGVVTTGEAARGTGVSGVCAAEFGLAGTVPSWRGGSATASPSASFKSSCPESESMGGSQNGI